MVSDNGRWYKIRYNDGDEEELTHREVTKFVNHTNRAAFVCGWTIACNNLVRKEQEKYQQVFSNIKDMEHKAYAITDPKMGKQMEYRELRRDTRTKMTWDRSAANEFGRLMQGIGTDSKHGKCINGTNTMFFIKKGGHTERQGDDLCTIRVYI